LSFSTAAGIAPHLLLPHLTILLLGTAVALGEPLLRVWLQRGRFGPEDTATVALLVQTLAPALLAWSVATPLIYALHALGRMTVPVVIALAGAALTAALASAGAVMADLPGIGAGISAGSAVTCLALGVQLLRNLEVPSVRPVLAAGGALVVTGVTASTAMFAVSTIIASVLPSGLLEDLARLAVGGTAGLSVAIIGGSALGIPEARRLADRLRRLLVRRA
jgi:putative peptidoglycan lipid II flippase